MPALPDREERRTRDPCRAPKPSHRQNMVTLMEQARDGRVSCDGALLGQRIRNFRVGLHLSQRAVADAIGRSPSAVMALEAGRTHSIELEVLRGLAEALRVDGHVLFSPLLGETPPGSRKRSFAAVSLFSG